MHTQYSYIYIYENAVSLNDMPVFENRQATEDEVRKIILSSPSKHCDMDPIPT